MPCSRAGQKQPSASRHFVFRKSVSPGPPHAFSNFAAGLNTSIDGAGSVPHFALELFRLGTGINIVHVPYKGAGPALIALAGGEVQLATLSMVAVLPHIKAGRLRAIAITTPTRSSVLPDLPAIDETVPGFEVVHWYGI